MSDWYGTRPSWRVPFEAAARRKFGTDLQTSQEQDLHSLRRHRRGGRDDGPDHAERLVFVVRNLEVDGRPALVDVVIRFWARPHYDTFGLAPEDFPRVHAEPGRLSPHRHRDDALCLWSPFDPPELRWHHSHGLLDLVEITRRHLFLERYWRMTGARNGGVWLLPDAPHGIPAA
ncbi:hypothetical protein [Actinomycetospora soli]|uniref:hypothetical protein n=1 Tax=Actinomycetospora soli TaxID=2893887 RepID=UPI001E41232F|nr:hypothetical protein [Actinomycetospora soli]MCD2190993.1 hypothetical protein [Actinomycetospora soli]